jgi:hypothetical protein
VVVGLCPTRSSGCAARILTMTNLYNQRPTGLDLTRRRLDVAVFVT